MSSALKRKATELAAAEAKKPKADGSITAFFGAPKKTAGGAPSTPSSVPASTTATATASTDDNATTQASSDAPGAAPAATLAPASFLAPPTSKFNKDRWVAKLSPEQRELLKLEIDTLHESWLAHLTDEILTPSFLELKRFLKRERENGETVFPAMENVYSW